MYSVGIYKTIHWAKISGKINDMPDWKGKLWDVIGRKQCKFVFWESLANCSIGGGAATEKLLYTFILAVGTTSKWALLEWNGSTDCMAIQDADGTGEMTHWQIGRL